MKDPFNTFIDDSVYTTKLDYYNLMFKTKRIFFQYLEQGKSLEDFKKRTEKIWEGIDHSYMAQRITELQDMIEARDLLDREILNPDAKYKEVYELAKERDYISKEKGYKKNVDRYYKEKIKTVEKEYIDKKAYLSELVEEYDKKKEEYNTEYEFEINKDTKIVFNNEETTADKLKINQKVTITSSDVMLPSEPAKLTNVKKIVILND